MGYTLKLISEHIENPVILRTRESGNTENPTILLTPVSGNTEGQTILV